MYHWNESLSSEKIEKKFAASFEKNETWATELFWTILAWPERILMMIIPSPGWRTFYKRRWTNVRSCFSPTFVSVSSRCCWTRPGRVWRSCGDRWRSWPPPDRSRPAWRSCCPGAASRQGSPPAGSVRQNKIGVLNIFRLFFLLYYVLFHHIFVLLFSTISRS